MKMRFFLLFLSKRDLFFDILGEVRIVHLRNGPDSARFLRLFAVPSHVTFPVAVVAYKRPSGASAVNVHGVGISGGCGSKGGC